MLRLEQAQDRINITSKCGVIKWGFQKKNIKRNRTNVLRNKTIKKTENYRGLQYINQKGTV